MFEGKQPKTCMNVEDWANRTSSDNQVVDHVARLERAVGLFGIRILGDCGWRMIAKRPPLARQQPAPTNWGGRAVPMVVEPASAVVALVPRA